jgi:hypothetical protein
LAKSTWNTGESDREAVGFIRMAIRRQPVLNIGETDASFFPTNHCRALCDGSGAMSTESSFNREESQK